MRTVTSKSELVKHSAAIQISNEITLLQRRAWNLLLWHAYDDLPERELHTISVADLTDALGLSTHNTAHIKNLLEGLTSSAVRWNVLGKDGRQKWGSASMLSYFEVERGVCTYGFGAAGSRLYAPSMYARIRLAVANRFGSKHALALYELASDYRGVHQTPWMNLTAFRGLMGLSDGEYGRWQDLKRYVIEKAMGELDRLADVRVSLRTRKKGRKIDEVCFLIQPRKLSAAATAENMSDGELLPPITTLRRTDVVIEREVDPFDRWFASLSPLERSALEAEAETYAAQQHLGVTGVRLVVAQVERMREMWQARAREQ